MLGGSLVFVSPYLLGLLFTLPIIWWLLRLTPPSPEKITFPALSLLRDLITPEQTPARTPWWLLLLRLVIATLLIVGFSEPIIDPQPLITGKGAMLIAIDNDWAATRNWDARQKTVQNLIHQAERENRSVILLPTTPPSTGEALQLVGPVAAKAAYADADNIKPQPWPADWKQALDLLTKIDPTGIADTFWLASGLGGAEARNFHNALEEIGLVRILGHSEIPIYLLTPPKNEDDVVALAVFRAETDHEAALSIAALAQDGHAVAHLPVNFKSGVPRATVPLDMPVDIRNQVARFEIEGTHSAATTILLDASWQRRSVGLVGDKNELAQQSLLSNLFYIDRALKPFADMHVDKLDALLNENMAVLILADNTELNAEQITKLSGWIKQGGVLVRFANDRLAATQNSEESALLPVALRTGDRAMGGTLSWSTPQKLRAFPPLSPFKGLVVPGDVTISRQILAEPTADLGPHTWATLEDGTPLVTAKTIGQGLSILFHVPSRSDWSNLPLSGLFVDMLRRVVDLSRGVGGNVDFSSLAPLRALDAFGDEQKPDSAAQPITENDFSTLQPGPQHPPGLYGTENLSRAFNLGHALGQPEALRGIKMENYKQVDGETELQPYLLTTTLVLLLIDFILSLFLRGILVLRRQKTSLALGLLLFLSFPVQAETDAKTAIELTSKTTLAYVETSNREADAISKQGLTGLANILQRRTSIDQIAVTSVNPDQDDLGFYSLLYWPITASAAPLSAAGIDRVNDYISHGGMILFDTMDGEKPSSMLMQRILDGVDIPPLSPLPENHVLKRSFYLLSDFPGRFANDDFWLEPEDMSSHDGVATVLAGSNGWAAAWAVDETGKPLFPCTPGGEVQRERAFRFGVNIVMYALTGNYKSDQLHAQTLLERMGK